MAISAAYTMDLYCECVDCATQPDFAYASYNPNRGMASYIGQTWGECAAEARRDGWLIGRDRDTCFAPGHKRVKASG